MVRYYTILIDKDSVIQNLQITATRLKLYTLHNPMFYISETILKIAKTIVSFMLLCVVTAHIVLILQSYVRLKTVILIVSS